MSGKDKDLYWVQKEWPNREYLQVGAKKIIKASLVNPVEAFC